MRRRDAPRTDSASDRSGHAAFRALSVNPFDARNGHEVDDVRVTQVDLQDRAVIPSLDRERVEGACEVPLCDVFDDVFDESPALVISHGDSVETNPLCCRLA